MRIFLMGGTGAIGRHAVPALVEATGWHPRYPSAREGYAAVVRFG